MASPSRLPSLRRPAGKSRPVSMIEGPLTNIPNLSSTFPEAETSKKAKRRSLLPQFSRRSSNEERDGTRIAEESEGDGSRPSDDTRDSAESNTQKAEDQDRKAMPPPSKLSRPMSMIPPRGSSQLAKGPTTRSHTRDASKDKVTDKEAERAQSLAALTGNESVSASAPVAVSDSGLKRSNSTRLPQTQTQMQTQIQRAAGPAIPSRTTSSRRKDVSSRTTNATQAPTTITEERSSPAKSQRSPPTAKYTDNQTSSTETSPTAAKRASVTYRPSSQMPQTTSPPRTAGLSRPRPTSHIGHPSLSKPAFNTFQQHYSPAKSSLPKPGLPSTKHASKPSITTDEDVPVSFDTTKQQIELLQLSLLHQSSTKCMNDYTASAKRKLGKMHNKLGKDYESIRMIELIHQRATNLSALDTWCPDTGLLVENLQILSMVYSDLTALMEEGSRHNDVASMFELWMNEADAPEPGTFIQPLPEEWNAAYASLGLKLRSIQRNLRVLPPTQPGHESSGVDIVSTACKSLVEDMLKELEVMRKLEKEIMAREKVRVESEVQSLLAADVEEKENRVPAWQRVV